MISKGVLEARLELARSCPRKILSLVCLPIPPLERGVGEFNITLRPVKNRDGN